MGIEYFLLAYAAGLVGAPFLKIPPYFLAIPPIVAVLWLTLRHRRLATVLLLAFFFTLGPARHALRTTAPGDAGHIRRFVGEQPVAVEGLVRTVVERPRERSTVDLEAKKVVSGGIAAPVRGKVRVHAEGPGLRAKPGDTVRFLTRLRAPRPFGTPGEFDYARYLADRGIFVTAHVRHAGDIAVLPRREDPAASTLIERRRESIARLIDSRLDPAAAALVRALAIGDKGGLTQAQRDLMSRGGVAHLFAISGLHLGLIALLLYAAGRFFYRRSDMLLRLGPPARNLPPLLLPLLLAYLLLTGSALPTLRAFLMTAAGVLLFCGARRTPPLKLLASTAFLILLVEPLALFRPAFQLSFAGILGIMVLLPRWREKLSGLPALLRRPATLFAATLAATLTTTPLVLHHFHMLATAGPIANLAAVPLIGLVAVPLALGGVLLSFVWPQAAVVLFSACGGLCQEVLSAVGWLIARPGLGGWRLYLAPAQIAGVALLAAAVLLGGELPRLRAKRVLLLAAGAALLFLHLPSSGLEVTALSVGQGESILLSLDDDHYLIDGGGLHSDTFDVGERLVAPALGRLGVDTLKAVILTHDHPDHRKGLVHVLEYFPTEAFWSAIPESELHPSLRRAIARKGIPVRLFRPGWTRLIETDEDGLALFVPDQRQDSINDRSLVVYARRGHDGVLLTGDLESSGVRDLLSRPPPGPVDLLKLPHHGSRHSEPQLLFRRFAPAAAFASAGRGNPYHLPHGSVIDDLRRRAIAFYRTDRDGSLRFASRGRGWQASHWQNGLFR